MPVKQILEDGIASYNISIKKIVTNTNAAVLLQHLAFWQGVAIRNGNNWVYKDWKDVSTHTGMTKSEIETAKKKLLGIKVIKAKVKQVPKKINEKFKMVPVTHYQVNYTTIEALITGFLKKEKTQKEDFLKNKKSSFSDIQAIQDICEIGKPDLSVEDSSKSLLGIGLQKYSFVKRFRQLSIKKEVLCSIYLDGMLIKISTKNRLYDSLSLKDLGVNDAQKIYSFLYKTYKVEGPNFLFINKEYKL